MTIEELVSENEPFLRNSVVLDVGSNVGDFSYEIIKKIPYKEIHMFEPCKKYFNISFNKLNKYKNIKFHNFAAGDESKDSIIYKSKTGNIGWNTLLAVDPNQGSDFIKLMDEEKIKIIKLDDYLTDLKELNFIKIDVEGYECNVIKGSLNLIKKFKPYILIEVGWGKNHPNYEENKKVYEELFKIGYETIDLNFNETKDILFKPINKKLPISLGIISWKDNNNLLNSLESYKKNGLFEICSDKRILFQEGTQKEIDIAKKYDLKYLITSENIGIGKAFKTLSDLSEEENILLLEHDWELIEPKKTAYERLLSGLILLGEGVSCVRYRHRKNYGEPLYSRRHYEGRELEFYDTVTELHSPHLMDCVHWLDDANKKFPNQISKNKEYFLANSRWANFTNNPCLYRKNFYSKSIENFVGKEIELEKNISRWWADQKFFVSQGEGLFKHNKSYKKYTIVDIFTYFNEKELLELRINLLKDFVDKFIICDANKTHSGESKEFSCKETLKNLGLLTDKIHIIETDLSCLEGSDKTWTRERAQRDIAKKHIEENDICIISDCDEIMNPEFIEYYSNLAINHSDCILRIPMTLLSGRADLRVCDENGLPIRYRSGFFCLKKHLEKYELSQIRESESFHLNNIAYESIVPTQDSVVEDAGWHFTWMGDNNKRLKKYQSFMHYYDIIQDSISPFSQKETEDFIENYMPEEGSVDVLGRKNHVLRKYPVEKLPKKIFELERVKNFLLPDQK
jgi:FkbM family methyltransferase